MARFGQVLSRPLASLNEPSIPTAGMRLCSSISCFGRVFQTLWSRLACRIIVGDFLLHPGDHLLDAGGREALALNPYIIRKSSKPTFQVLDLFPGFLVFRF